MFLDKNNHPDAKKAFEAVAAAYEALSDPTARSDYDIAIMKRLQSQRSLHVQWNRANDLVQDLHARLLLFLARVRRGQVKEELDILRKLVSDRLVQKKQSILDFYYKLKFAPSTKDRGTLVGELVWSKKWDLISYLVVLRFMMLS